MAEKEKNNGKRPWYDEPDPELEPLKDDDKNESRYERVKKVVFKMADKIRARVDYRAV